MSSPVLRGLLMLGGFYLLAVASFVLSGMPGEVAVYLGGTYALTAVAALLFSRGVLEFLIGVEREIAFFVVLKQVSDPLLALIAPITPGFLLPFAVSLYGAFLFFMLKLFLFGDAYLGVPPLFIVIYLVLASVIR